MFNAICVKLSTQFDGHVAQAKKTQIRFTISQGHIKHFWYEFVKHRFGFVEIAAALNEFLYSLLKSR